LAAKLTSWRIDIKSLTEAASDSLHKLQSDAAFIAENADLAEVLPQIEATLAKKAEGRPVTPEEYTLLNRFVDRLERGEQFRREAVLDAAREERAALEATMPPSAFELPLEDLGLPPSLSIKISGEGFSTIGDLMLQLKTDPDRILAINGVGPKALDTINEALGAFKFPEPVKVKPEPVAPKPEAQPEPEPEPEAVAEQAPVAEVEEGPVQLSEEDERLLAEMQGKTTAQAEAPKASVDEIFARTAEQLLGKQKSRRPSPAPAAEAKTAEADKKKKKKKFRELEYDPDTDTTIVKRRGEEWEEQ
jgi:N utilization substance protein A